MVVGVVWTNALCYGIRLCDMGLDLVTRPIPDIPYNNLLPVPQQVSKETYYSVKRDLRPGLSQIYLTITL
jgi:hypothetical protein